MCGIPCGIVTLVIGVAFVITSTIVGYVVIPDIIEDRVIDEMTLIDDTIQMERFKAVPFALNFTIRFFNISNVDDVLAGGVPIVNEVGPYTYKLYQTRDVEEMEGDIIKYRRLENFEFDPVASFPNTEDDIVTITNVAYHAVLQMAQSMFPALMALLSTALSGVFGQNNSPVIRARVRDLLFDGVPICQNPGLFGEVACIQIRGFADNVQNMVLQEDGSLTFTFLAYKDNKPSNEYVAHRGLEDPLELGKIITYNNASYLSYWVYDEVPDGDDEPGICNMINGTDSGIFPPFVDRDRSIFAINTDICRSVELRYQYDTEYEGIPVVRYSANEWFLDNDEGCFCLNVTKASGHNRENGCLLRGAAELYSCVGAFLVLSYPHFLYADFTYRNGLLGMNPVEDNHRIFVDLEPLTGTVIRAAKRAQFNIFARPVPSIGPTQNLRTTLMPVFWIEESMSLPKEFVEELTDKLLSTLHLINILLPIAVALSCLVVVIGIAIIVRYALLKKYDDGILSSSPGRSSAK
ncbi:sensory neuron membrane protein 2 [Epargyreus clarus]|uniref:sensory neuron membrane protein 2 n=1 Tax=Epargyreus clarus TaxID=520877 RepID=UPI003C2F7B83